MRKLTDTQRVAFNNETLTIASVVEIYANDGTAIKLTDHDIDLGPYVARHGLDMSAIVLQLGGTGQTATVTMLPDKGAGKGVTYGMIEGGLLDNALVKCYWCDYTRVPLDPIQIFEGYCYEAKYGNSALIELSISSLLSTSRPLCKDIMQQTCRADFGDALCGIDIHVMVDGPHVFAPVDGQSFVMTRDEVTPVGYYNNGTLYFKTGDNKGLGYEILTVSQADANGRETIYTKVPFAFDVQAGDYFFLYPGCDKIITSGCTYWNNTANFQGEPYVADQSNILPPPSDLTVKASGINTGMPAICNWWLTQYIKVGFGKTILFAPGTRAADGQKTSHVGPSTINYFDDFMIPSDAYTAIFNLLGSLDNIVAYDGSITPKDPDKQKALSDAGFIVQLNLNMQDIQIGDPTYTVQVASRYAYAFFKLGTDALRAALKGSGADPTYYTDQGTVSTDQVVGVN